MDKETADNLKHIEQIQKDITSMKELFVHLDKTFLSLEERIKKLENIKHQDLEKTDVSNIISRLNEIESDVDKLQHGL